MKITYRIRENDDGSESLVWTDDRGPQEAQPTPAELQFWHGISCARKSLEMRKPKTVKAMNAAWLRLMVIADEHPSCESRVSKAFNAMLDDLLDSDFFGTEGQLDPRKDHRD